MRGAAPKATVTEELGGTCAKTLGEIAQVQCANTNGLCDRCLWMYPYQAEVLGATAQH